MNKLAILPLMFWFFCSGAYASELGHDEILKIFNEYESLNADFISSVNHGKGKSGKTYKVLRSETESYADGPFDTALGAAQKRVCEAKDLEIINALFRVTIATSNSANESPMTVLGNMFVCQLELVKNSFLQLSISEQKTMYHDLEFGFENTVYGNSKNDNRIICNL